jgi:probable rRNA maturation factor
MKLVISSNRYKTDNKQLEKAAKTAFSLLNDSEGEIELNFVSPINIRKINKDYRDHDMATDVLSFKLSDKPVTGQIFICYNKAKEWANKLEKRLDDEIVFLMIHGILHVFDYNHENIDECKEMEEKENIILKELGLVR